MPTQKADDLGVTCALSVVTRCSCCHHCTVYSFCAEPTCADEGKEFTECAKTCPRTCADLGSAVQCDETKPEDCAPSCVCKEGMLEQDGEWSAVSLTVSAIRKHNAELLFVLESY